MKRLKHLLGIAVLLVLSGTALAHAGHGVAGTVGHDLQHQLWNFAGLVFLGVLLLGGDQVVALVRRKSNDKDNSDR